MYSDLSEELEVNVEMHQVPVLSPFLLAVVVDAVTKLKKCILSELLHADDLVLMSETNEGLRDNFRKWKDDFESM